MSDMIHRRAARALLISAESTVLLMRIRLDDGSRIWITPGGGIEDGEDISRCLKRELREELGLVKFQVGPLLWRRQHTFSFYGKRYCQSEEYYAVHVGRFDPVMIDATEARLLDEFRWWRISELHLASERLTPLSLKTILESYLREGPPKEVGYEVLID